MRLDTIKTTVKDDVKQIFTLVEIVLMRISSNLNTK